MKATYYAVVNTFNKAHETFGRVESKHRTLENALKSEKKIQEQVKRRNGPNSYIPLAIVRLKCTRNVGESIACEWNRREDGLMEIIENQPFGWVAELIHDGKE